MAQRQIESFQVKYEDLTSVSVNASYITECYTFEISKLDSGWLAKVSVQTMILR
jgi:hypothetical protein